MPLTPWIAAATLAPVMPNLHFQGGRFQSAQAAYQSFVKKHPLTRVGYEGLLLSLLRQDRWQEAVALGERVPFQDSELAGLWALANLRGGQPTRAQELAEAAWRQEPAAFWPLVALGTIALRWEADTRAAQGYLRQAVELRPDSPEAWLALLAAVHDPEEADRVEQQLVRLAPQGYPFAFWSVPLRQRATTVARYSAAFPKGQTFCPSVPPPATQTLTLHRDRRGMLYFDAELDGLRFRLLYDTGGGRHLILTPQALARLKPTFVTSTLITGLQGQSKGDIHRGERLRLGALELNSLPIESTSGNLGGFDGLIGWRALGERVQRLDLSKNTLTLQERPSPPDERSTTLPLHLIQDQPVFELECVRETPTKRFAVLAILDTGSVQDLFSLRAGGQLSQKQGRREVIKQAVGIGQSHAQIEFRTFPVTFTLCAPTTPLALYAQATAASFLDTVYSPATGIEHGLLLGMDFVSRYAIIELDPMGHTLRLVPR
jgi:tetratricopeptide (TPR) repeat protein